MDWITSYDDDSLKIRTT